MRTTATGSPGAAILESGALRAGAGKLQIATARSVAAAVAVNVPEARVIGLRETRSGELAAGCHESLLAELAKANAILMGPGMSDEKAGVAPLSHYTQAKTRAPLVADAAALRVFQNRQRGRGTSTRIVATPHASEMAELWGCSRAEVLRRPLEVALAAAESWESRSC